MSNKLVNLVDMARIGDSTAKAVLRKIADQSNDAGSGVWSSHNYLAWIIEVDRTTVTRKMKYLYELGVLDWQNRSGSTNTYGLNVVRLMELALPYRDRIEQMEDIIARAKGVWQDATGVSQDATGDVADGNTSPLIVPNEPETEVIYPDGRPVPEKKICERCGKAPKAKGAKKYCEECAMKATAEWQEKKSHMAVRSYEQRIPGYYLNEQQVDLIIQAVGDKPADQKRWAMYLDHWILNGWHIGQAGLANVVQAFKDDVLQDKIGTPATVTVNTGNQFLPPRPEA